MNDDAIKSILWACLLGMVLATAAVKCVACTSTLPTTARVESAVTVLAEVVEPSYGLAMSGCIARERAEVDAERRGLQASADTDKRLEVIRTRCDAVRAGFDKIVNLLDDAAHAIDEGAVEEAERQLKEVRGLWATLQAP